MQIVYWKYYKGGNKFCSVSKRDREVDIVETITPTEKTGVLQHVMYGKEKKITFTTRCGYDRGPKHRLRMEKLIGEKEPAS